jgi:hypothetical protein
VLCCACCAGSGALARATRRKLAAPLKTGPLLCARCRCI